VDFNLAVRRIDAVSAGTPSRFQISGGTFNGNKLIVSERHASAVADPTGGNGLLSTLNGLGAFHQSLARQRTPPSVADDRE